MPSAESPFSGPDSNARPAPGTGAAGEDSAAGPPPPPDSRAEAERAQAEADRLADAARNAMPGAPPDSLDGRLSWARYWKAKSSADKAAESADFWAGTAYSDDAQAGKEHWRLPPEERDLAENDWWQRREELYRQRDDVRPKAEAASARRAPREEELRARRLALAREGRSAAGKAAEYGSISDELTRLQNDPQTRDPSAREDPYEQEAFNRRFLGRPDPERAARAAAEAARSRDRLARAGLDDAGPAAAAGARRPSSVADIARAAVVEGLFRAADHAREPVQDRGRPRRFGILRGMGPGRGRRGPGC